ncbi:MAG: UvrD-helicase domain-containing protein [Planctomycetes bacterium]|jgi:DNA helicase-2/ATP-dependent DNA helicase PcrA|nr:UvrD-helicase domain-containing protein [Planctomycetota bacterium]
MDLLSDLNPEQRDAVTCIEGPLLVLAGPGSGKTRVITTRIAWMISQGIKPWHILAMTFTNKAAAEMKQRVERWHPNAGAQVSTFHSFGAFLLRREAEALGYARDFTIYDTDDRLSLVRRIMKEKSIDAAFVSPGAAANLISDAKNRGISARDFAAGAYDPKLKAVADVFAGYEQALARHNALDFDDLLVKPLELLQKNPEVLEKYRQRFLYVLIDEYQDTNAIQYGLSRLLSATHRNLCVTGDPDQSIYSWRGADIRNILNFERDFPEARTVVLGRNYRSTANIVKAADALVARNLTRKHKHLTTDNEPGRVISVLKCQDEQHEARSVAETIETITRDGQVRRGDVAVFFRTNAQSRVLEQAMRERNLPYQLMGAVSFYQRQEIKDVLAYLRLILNPRDAVSFARVLERPARGVGDGTVAKLVEAAVKSGLSPLDVAADPKAHGVSRVPARALQGLKELADMYARLARRDLYPIEDVVRTVIVESGYEQMLRTDVDPRSQERLENVNELVSDARTRQQEQPDIDLRTWLEQVALASDTDRLDLAADSVKLMTLHSAKGLEFDAVFLTGLEENVLPHARSVQGDGDVEEERRLCYVGITRARKLLTLSLARHREAFGRAQRNSPSRFLHEIPTELTAVDDRADTAAWGGQDFARWFTGRAARPATRQDDNDDPFDFGDLPPVEDGPADHLAAATPPPVVPADPRQLQAGDRVRHGVFGIGRVLEVNSTGRVKVHFQGWGEKSLALEFARLEKM